MSAIAINLLDVATAANVGSPPLVLVFSSFDWTFPASGAVLALHGDPVARAARSSRALLSSSGISPLII